MSCWRAAGAERGGAGGLLTRASANFSAANMLLPSPVTRLQSLPSSHLYAGPCCSLSLVTRAGSTTVSRGPLQTSGLGCSPTCSGLTETEAWQMVRGPRQAHRLLSLACSEMGGARRSEQGVVCAVIMASVRRQTAAVTGGERGGCGGGQQGRPKPSKGALPPGHVAFQILFCVERLLQLN